MCRMLMVRSNTPFPVASYLPQFAAMCQKSEEYQGHGWGLAFKSGPGWRIDKSITPIWEDDRLGSFGEATFLAVHARSAFRNEGIVVENNMPFCDDRRVFLFNGELHGVRIREEGRIGAEKIFNYIRRFDRLGEQPGFQKATTIIRERSRAIRGMNILMTDGHKIFLHSYFAEQPHYFTMYQQQAEHTAFCSQPLDGRWEAIPNQTTLVT